MSIKISILVEGATEMAFFPKLREFLKNRLSANTMPKLDPVPFEGRLPTGDTLKRHVMYLLSSGKPPSDAVIALTDVYTGTQEFANAQNAKNQMRKWVGDEPRFHPHVAHHDFEAWLLPFWKDIQKLAGSNRTCPSNHPEHVNHGKSPAYHLYFARLRFALLSTVWRAHCCVANCLCGTATRRNLRLASHPARRG